eukprot:gnl/TRDRNA2_/TRDRNA2_156135_c1_seq3.p1 gnl/TRDRNA2_/TRDRNA2_156135_c1~~gnl/TRDRNA2_/TRDRNA2_156135_c1_seq3.p1  ORF type:complete len:692 (+),score=138.36 gnl/TRDRNA2_/TRDRNA2_156135_c1_seq3:121-2196(+)
MTSDASRWNLWDNASPLFEVVGGKESGGILVRDGPSMTAAQLPSRLASGSWVQQLAIAGERIKYRRLAGEGPDQGWVALRIKGKELLEKRNGPPDSVKAKGGVATADNGKGKFPLEIALLSLGTRGDMQPVVALALALQEKGHRAQIYAPENFKAWAKQYNLRFVAVSEDMEDLIGKSDSENREKQKVLDEMTNKVFEAFDSDKDGLLNYSEAARIKKECNHYRNARLAEGADKIEGEMPIEEWLYWCTAVQADPEKGWDKSAFDRLMVMAGLTMLVDTYKAAADILGEEARADVEDYVGDSLTAQSEEEDVNGNTISMEGVDPNLQVRFMCTGKIFYHEAFDKAIGEQKPDLLLYTSLGASSAWAVERKYGIANVEIKFQLSELTPRGGAEEMKEVSRTVGEEPLTRLIGTQDFTWEDVKEAARPTYEVLCKMEKRYVTSVYGVAPIQDMGFDYWWWRTDQEGQLIAFLAAVKKEKFMQWLAPSTQEMLHRHTYTGFWFLDDPKAANGDASLFGGAETLKKLEDFLNAGPAAYVGWGSCLALNGLYMVKLAVAALKVAGMRGILLGGWAKLSMETLKEAVGPSDPDGLVKYAEANVLFIEKAPHTWLFPKCSVLVNHGGIGTLSASWRSGTPVLMTPIWLDQMYTAPLVNAFQWGTATKPLQILSAQELGATIRHCATDKGIRQMALATA